MSLRKVMLLTLLIAFIAGAALVSFILWSGRGIVETPQASTVQNAEWLTVTNGAYEFRGTVYQTTEALSTGLSQLQPKPVQVNVRWVAAADPSSTSTFPIAQAQRAREALVKADIATPAGIVGNQIFMPKTAESSGAR